MLPHNVAGGGSPQRQMGGSDPAAYFAGLDPSSSKQLAALTAAGNARRATQAGPSGLTSGPFVGGMHQQSHSYGHASPVLGHHLSPPALANSASFNMSAQTDPAALYQRPSQPTMMTQNPQQQQSQNLQHIYRQRQMAFLSNLARLMMARNTPLPPAITGVQVPYDPTTSPWKLLEPASEVGGIKVAGRDVDLFKLWGHVSNNGGSGKFQQQNLWSTILPQFGLPETLSQPGPDGSMSTAHVLANYYMAILTPFEESVFRNMGDQRQSGASNTAQNRLSMPFTGQGQASMSSAVPPGGLQQQQLPASGPVGGVGPFAGQTVPQTPQMRPASSMMGMMQAAHGMSPPAATPPQGKIMSGGALQDFASPSASTGLDFDVDAEGRKRKLTDFDEMNGKRTRQKTGDSDQPVTPQRGETAAALHSQMPTTPTPANNARGQPHRRKIEYVPLGREIDSAGGRDLQLIQNELQQLAVGRQSRVLDEWGRVHIDALTMSLRSRISTELSYALTTLNLLSTLRTRQPDSGISINHCDELVEEILDLLVDTAFEGLDDRDEPADDNTPIITHKQLLTYTQEEMSCPFAVSGKKRGGYNSSKVGPVQRRGDLVKMIVNVLRNFSAVGENQAFFAQHPILTDLLLRITSLERAEPGSAPQPVSTALTLPDILVVRRDVMNMLVNLAGHISFSGSSSPSGDARKARRLFELVSSFVVDPTESLPPIAWIMQAGLPPTPNTRAPLLTDAALEVFTRASQPDSNRQAISQAVPGQWMYSLFSAIVHRLPAENNDFVLAMRETPLVPEAGGSWQSYIEKLAMSLYSLAFLMPPSMKKRVREDRSLSFSRVMFRFVRRCLSGGGPYGSIQGGQDVRHFFYVATRRAIECMKIIEDGGDTLDTAQSNGGSSGAALLSFGIGYGEMGDKQVEKGNGMWGSRREDVLWLMARDVDDVMFSELESLARVDC